VGVRGWAPPGWVLGGPGAAKTGKVQKKEGGGPQKKKKKKKNAKKKKKKKKKKKLSGNLYD